MVRLLLVLAVQQEHLILIQVQLHQLLAYLVMLVRIVIQTIQHHAQIVMLVGHQFRVVEDVMLVLLEQPLEVQDHRYAQAGKM